MRIITVVGIAILGLASAQSSQEVATMLLPNMDGEPWVASVIGENAAATTYFVTCGPESGDNCGGAPGFTAIQGPKTAAYYYSLTASDVLVSYGCSVGGTTTAICQEKVTGTGAENPGVSTFTLGPSELAFMYTPVTVTAGSLTQDTSGTTSVTSTSSGGVPAATATNSSQTSSGTSTTPQKTSQQSTASSATSTSTGGVPMMTGSIKLAVGGAMLAFAGAAI